MCVHTDLPDNKNAAKNIRFCAFTLLRFCETHCCILERFQKPPFLCVHIDQMRFQKPPFLWISTFDSVFENLRFCGVFVRISVNTFTKTEVFLSVFVQKRSSVNGALDVSGMALHQSIRGLCPKRLVVTFKAICITFN